MELPLHFDSNSPEILSDVVLPSPLDTPGRMSRAVRKAQRQKLEDIAPQETGEPKTEESEEEEEPVATAPNPFDLLNAAEQESEDESRPHSSNGDSELAQDEQEDLELAIEASLPRQAPSKKKSKNKKKKAKKGKMANQEEAKGKSEDEFDAVLAAHNEALSEMPANDKQSVQFNITELLAVDIKMLDPNAEMRRLFGSKVVSSERAERVTMNRRNMPRGLQQQQANRGRKSVLVPVEDNYPLNIKGGLEMSMIEDVDGIRTFKFEHSKAYQQTQFTFMQCVQSGDPQTLMNLLSRAPFHVDTLLQVSEIMRHQGDNEQSLDMLTRALFAFDRAFHPLFNVATGLVRLPFEYPENRPFYLAIYRYIQSLGRRGCWSTAFEFNKLLYALAPEEDPYAALLSIDFYAVKARRWDFIEKLCLCPWSQVLDDDYPKPNFNYAKALGTFSSLGKKDDGETAQQELASAVQQFPYFTGSLFSELKAAGPIQYDNLEPATTFGSLVRDLYVFRAKDIWNTPELIKFLRDSSLPVEDFRPCEFPESIPINISRHILLLDERTLLHYLPKEITSASYMSFDPLPPEDSLPSYLDAYMPRSGFGNGSDAGSGTTIIPQFIQDLLRRVLPTATNERGEIDRDLNDEEVARLMQEMQFQEDEGNVAGEDLAGMDFADPNGYGANRGLDEPDQEGNAGRRR